MAEKQELWEAYEKLSHYFVVGIPPEDKRYYDRIVRELEIIVDQRFADHFIKVHEIMRLTVDIPHITRGSAGSSLICYLMGITNIDPIASDLPLARFMNPKRDDLPDVDIDFPHHKQEEVMNRIFKRWPGKCARLSNYVTFKKKSALKEAAKRCDVDCDMGRDFNLQKVPVDKREMVRVIAKKLEGKKNYISKHCGGIVFFDRGLPKSLINNENQILLDKNETEDLAILKVDILSSRGLSQITDINNIHPFNYPGEDEKTAALLQRADTIGVIQGESPVFRRVLRNIQPGRREDTVLATALIRPAAVTGRREATFFRDMHKTEGTGKIRYKGGIVYDDDAIALISRELGVNEYDADMYRRAFIKRNEEKVMEFVNLMGQHPDSAKIMHLLRNMDGFGLCKAHSINLGNLIWALAYEKAHNPMKFWASALNNACSMYRDWVHFEEAKWAGWQIQGDRRPFIPDWESGTLRTPNYKLPLFDSNEDEFRARGWWSGSDFLSGMFYSPVNSDWVELRGLIATGRRWKTERGWLTFITVATGPKQYCDLVIEGSTDFHPFHWVEGIGKPRTRQNSTAIEMKTFSYGRV